MIFLIFLDVYFCDGIKFISCGVIKRRFYAIYNIFLLMRQQSKIEQQMISKELKQKCINPEQFANKSQLVSQLLKTSQYQFVAKSISFLYEYTTEDILEELYLSFNGGKDATVVLYLFKIALQKKKKQYSGYSGNQKPLKCLYFTEPNSFEKVDAFKDLIIKQNSFQMQELPTKSYAKQLTTFAKTNKLKYIIMGSRKDDPYCQNLGMQAKSDVLKGYPDFIRLNPIIQWSHEQVWKFILNFNIPYCELYKEGYTYLGNKDNTIKNTQLYDNQTNIYKPAYEASTQMQKQSRGTKITSTQHATTS